MAAAIVSAAKTTARTARAPKTTLTVVGPAHEETTEFSLSNAALAALESSRANTFLCDTDFNVVYANKNSSDILEALEQDLRKQDAWKEFRATEIVGASVDFLFTDEPVEFKRASNLRNHPYQKEIKMGPFVFDVQVTGNISDTGEFLGYLVDWENITERIVQEKRLQQLTTVLEDSTSNTLLCDLEWNVRYANKNSVYILESIEPTLHQHDSKWRHFRANEIVGRSLEWLFTNEPEEFRRATDTRNHPYRKDINIGPCTCDITVTSTRDPKGEVTGYAVYWEHITERLRLAQQASKELEEAKHLATKVEDISQVMKIITKDGNLNTRIIVEKDDLIGDLGNTINAMTESLILMARGAEMIASGDLSVAITPKSDKDVLGIAFRTMTESLMVMARDADKIASGDLTVQMTPKSDKDLLGNALHTMLGNLRELVGQTKVAADGIAQASSEVSIAADDLSQRTEEQASSLEETASSMEEMTATVKQNANNAKEANQMAAQAREVAERGGSVVAKAVTSMEEINKASKRIADIISVIDEIAFQTNLLALNAAVEAARVGEQGRGFAVVAAEVRNLAGRSATAAKEIKSLVQDSVQKVQEGSTLVNQSGQNLEEIVGSVKKVADIIAEISAASQEQSAGIEQVNKAIMQMDQITQQNSALVEETAAATQSMTQQTQDLKDVVGRFQLSPSYLQSMVQKADATRSTVQYAPQRQASAPVRGNLRSNRSAGSIASTPVRRLAGRPVADDDGFEEF